MKHLFVDEVKCKDLIPVFIELKDLNSINGEYEISDFIFQRLYDLGSTIKKEYMHYALRSGCFLFLLDGYDEIASDKKDIFFKKLDSFCDRYSDNYFVISSRPYSEFVEFQRFTVLTLCSLSKDQAISLIEKIEFDNEIKQRFKGALSESLYDKHKSFASNPLLLNIMLLTFDNYAEIPEKLHLFYDNAFETLYSKHDATKAGYRRELRSNLSYDSFKKVFSYFCFITYYHGKIELTHDEIISTLERIRKSFITFTPEDYIFDLINSVCVIYKEGLNYKFTHRSFQEFFSAVFLKELSDQDMQKMGVGLIKKDCYRVTHDSVFKMLKDMADQRFEQNILLPILNEIEATCEDKDKYDFYFEKMSPAFEFTKVNTDDKDERLILYGFNDSLMEFLFEMTRCYIIRDAERTARISIAEKRLLNYLVENTGYFPQKQIKGMDYRKDATVYALIRNTWIGEAISVLSNTSVELRKKRVDTELDLSGLLLE